MIAVLDVLVLLQVPWHRTGAASESKTGPHAGREVSALGDAIDLQARLISHTLTLALSIRNIPFSQVLTKRSPNDDYFMFLPKDQLAEVFRQNEIDPANFTACSCGSGITASVVALGLHLLGSRNYAVYDGSWAEWGSHPESVCPVVKESS